MSNPSGLVYAFHVAFGRPVRDVPDVGTPEERVLRVRLMLEEVLEFAKAAGVEIFPASITGLPIIELGDLQIRIGWRQPNLAQMAHELADVEYVVRGSAIQLGIPLDACMEEIHRANMRKLGPDGKPVVDAHGKVRKPEGWEPADVGRVLEEFKR